MPPPRPSVPPHRAMPPAPASPQVTGAGIPFAPVIQDPSLSSTSSRLMRRRKQASTNIVWYIAIPVTGLLLLGLAGLLVLLITKKDKHTGAKESVTAEVAGQSRLVGTWQLDLDAMVREEGVTGREAEMALAQLQSMGLEFEFDFRNDGSLEFHAKLPDEGLQRESGKWSVKNTRGDGMEIAFDVDGQFLDETLIIRFLDNDHWRADFGGETIVLRRVQ